MSTVDHPSHYGGEENPYEAIKVIEAWELGFCLGNTVKYISRAGKKDLRLYGEDLKKARWYLDREIAKYEAFQAAVQKFQDQTREELRQVMSYTPPTQGDIRYDGTSESR